MSNLSFHDNFNLGIADAFIHIHIIFLTCQACVVFLYKSKKLGQRESMGIHQIHIWP